MIKPIHPHKGMKVAVLSPSWGGPSVFPHIYNNGLLKLEELGFKIKEYASARASEKELEINPKMRAGDINNAFLDKEVGMIVSSIGGSDSIKILPYLDTNIITSNPKIFMGYSDTCTILAYLNTLGLVTFHGPCVMSGFSQYDSLPQEFKDHVNSFLFNKFSRYEYVPFNSYSDGYPDWSKKDNTGIINLLKPTTGWKFLKGEKTVRGRLWGGSMETLERLKDTKYWPNLNFFKGKILFLETSENKPAINEVRSYLEDYGKSGILQEVSAIIFGRCRDYSDMEKSDFDDMILEVVDRYCQEEIIVVTNMDFGHTDPQLIIPLGINAQINPREKSFELLESPFY